jgi:hypothetical protein
MTINEHSPDSVAILAGRSVVGRSIAHSPDAACDEVLARSRSLAIPSHGVRHRMATKQNRARPRNALSGLYFRVHETSGTGREGTEGMTHDVSWNRASATTSVIVVDLQRI